MLQFSTRTNYICLVERAFILCLVLMALVIENLWTGYRYRKGIMSHVLYVRSYNDGNYKVFFIVIGSLIIFAALVTLALKGYSEFFAAMILAGLPSIAYGLTVLPRKKLKYLRSCLVMPDKQLVPVQVITSADIHPDHLIVNMQHGTRIRADHLEIRLREVPDIISFFERVIPGIPVNIHIQAP